MSLSKRFLKRQSQNTNERHDSGMPSRDYRYRDVRFRETGGSKLMSVDGSSVPVDFVIKPPTNELWIIDYVTLLLIDPGDMGPEVFGGMISALLNGLELIESINGIESTYTTIEDNADLAQCFFGGSFTAANSPAADPGFLNSVDKAVGRMEFDGKIILDGEQADALILRNNDNLLGIDYLAASAHIRTER